jgi:hypothetical protein
MDNQSVKHKSNWYCAILWQELGRLPPAVPPGQLNNLQEAMKKINLFKYVDMKY